MNVQGISLPFSDQGIDPAAFGFPLWNEVWSKVIIIGSDGAPLRSGTGGRLILNIRCIEGENAGKEHIIGLNYWHPDQATAERAKRELASITNVTGRHQINSTGELHNIPFYVLPVTTTGKPTPEVLNPQPQTNFRGYRDVNGNEPGKSAGGGGMVPTGGPPATFAAPQQQPQFNPGAQQPQFIPGQQQQQPAFNPGQPQQQFVPQVQQQPQFDPNANPQQQQFQPAQVAPQQQQQFVPQGQPQFNPGQQQAPQTQATWQPQGAAPVQQFQPQGQPQQQFAPAPNNGAWTPPR